MEHPNHTTLCYLERDGQYLMLLRNKKQDDCNAGKWIGVGGKFEPGETAEQCALREIREETGLTVRDLAPRGIVYFYADGFSEVMHLFTATRWDGVLTGCDEGELRWIDKSAVFDLNLWDGDRVFLEFLARDEPYFEMTLRYRGDRLYQCVVNGTGCELFDILRPDGTPAGMVAERGYAHRHGLWHAAAHIWVVRPAPGGDEVLLQLRSAKKKLYPSRYDTSSAGHIDAGEDVLTGAAREVEEELGLPVTPEELRPVAVIPYANDSVSADGEMLFDREYRHVYLFRAEIADSDIVCQPSEVDGVMWLKWEELLRAVRDNAIPHCLSLSELETLAAALN